MACLQLVLSSNDNIISEILKCHKKYLICLHWLVWNVYSFSQYD